MKTLKNPRKLLSGTVFILALAVLPFGWWSMSNGNSKEIEVEGALCAEGQSPNRLAREKSPYLLQHACNPVDWYSWGEEAFQKAREEEKPIFLSIGYSTCHWCHVMERESFEKEEIAAIMNEHFVSIKVDREELPNVDRVYMTFVQVSTGSGGWPMSVFLDPTPPTLFRRHLLSAGIAHGNARIQRYSASNWRGLEERPGKSNEHGGPEHQRPPRPDRDLGGNRRAVRFPSRRGLRLFPAEL